MSKFRQGRKMGHSSEPTVEEILESIKQVIARDNRVGAAGLRRERETRGMPDDDVLDLGSDSQVIDESESDEPVDTAEDGPLLGDVAKADIGESLAALAMLTQPGAQPQIVRSGETSIESLVREMLRPELAEWLEKNLPTLVERLVADEIRRISGNRG
jgi:cell pole-organizing protein PopZ